MPDPEADGCDEYEAEVAVSGLVVTGSRSAAVLEFGEAPLDQISQGVEMAVDDGLDLSVVLGRDDGGSATGGRMSCSGAKDTR